MGQRGSPKILHNGFSYICAKSIKNRKYWVCAKQRSKKCKARIITDEKGESLKTRNVEHNHQAEYNEWKNEIQIIS